MIRWEVYVARKGEIRVEYKIRVSREEAT